MAQQYDEITKESKNLAQRMRMGTGAAKLLSGENAPTHHMDALQRFQKDFAAYERQRREEQKTKRQSQLQQKRIEQLQRENRRWQLEENYHNKLKERQQFGLMNQKLGIKRTANTNGLAYNPINLQYDRNPEGQKLKLRDEDSKIRGYVRAHNMDYRGNSKYNPLTGQDRLGIQKIIPEQLNNRFEQKKNEHYDNMRLKVPSSSSSIRSNPYNKYY